MSEERATDATVHEKKLLNGAPGCCRRFPPFVHLSGNVLSSKVWYARLRLLTAWAEEEDETDLRPHVIRRRKCMADV
jgi:hypothetical protein